ncbi:MAG: UDP-glucose 4-epimerase GalE [Alphaproteobacteria bacterium]|nr:UDP-glucose 4-epimerase GalE [Alphaproteobacteria bacterium]
MSVLVTGGAGYIGSHMTLALADQGDKVVVLDNLTTGVRAQVAEAATFVQGDIRDTKLVREVLEKHQVEAVIHFAGSIVVPESVENPLFYYANNTAASRDLIEACVASGVKKFIFSSTAAVYGATDQPSIAEDGIKAPESPYGRSKLMTEWMLADTAMAHDFRYVALRYFNVAGADPKGRSGQSTPRATHLIKRACQVALGRVPYLGIFGTDYPTPDGTGIRDYIHVSDLIGAHALALGHLRNGADSSVFNCGYGHGFSVREVVKAVERVAGKALAVKEMPRRAGDPPMIVSNPAKLKAALGWKPEHDALDEIVAGALAWESRLNST